MKSILTVIGKDKVGIISGVSNELTKFNINIINVNQTIMDGYFTMIMILDCSNTNKSFEYIQKELLLLSDKLKVDIKIQREEIFDSMHSL